MKALKEDCNLIGKTLPEAQLLCSGKRFIIEESNGRFAEGTPRIVRAKVFDDYVEVVVSNFKEI